MFHTSRYNLHVFAEVSEQIVEVIICECLTTFHVLVGRVGFTWWSSVAGWRAAVRARRAGTECARSSLGRMPTQPDWTTPFLFRLIHLATVAGPTNSITRRDL